MNDDAKSKLQDKISAVVGDEELDKVAGGTYEQNLEILNAMAKLDFEGVQNVFAQVNDSAKDDAGDIISQGAEDLLDKHFEKLSLRIQTDNTIANQYRSHSYEYISHEQMLKMINDKAKALRG